MMKWTIMAVTIAIVVIAGFQTMPWAVAIRTVAYAEVNDDMYHAKS